MKKINLLTIFTSISCLSMATLPLSSCNGSNQEHEDTEQTLKVDFGQSTYNFQSLESNKQATNLSITLIETVGAKQTTTEIKLEDIESYEVMSDNKMIRDSISFDENGKYLCFDGYIKEGEYSFKIKATYKNSSISGISNDITLNVGPIPENQLSITVDENLEGEVFKEGESANAITIKIDQVDVTDKAKFTIYHQNSSTNLLNNESIYIDNKDKKIKWKDDIEPDTYKFTILVEAQDSSFEWINGWSSDITLTIYGPVVFSPDLNPSPFLPSSINVFFISKEKWKSQPAVWRALSALDVYINGKLVKSGVDKSTLSSLSTKHCQRGLTSWIDFYESYNWCLSYMLSYTVDELQVGDNWIEDYEGIYSEGNKSCTTHCFINYVVIE